MAIGAAVQKGSFAHIYDPKGHHLGTVAVSAKSPEGLVGFTSTTVSVRKGARIFTYDKKGRHIACFNAT
jgi:hypothetical protein